MSRPLRVLYPNAWYHVMNRGAGKKDIFKNNLHRNIFLETLEECHDMFNLNIHAYCLMGNHYHLLVSTPDANLSRAMRHINGVYTQRYNRHTKTDGPLFRGRYKAQLIEDDCYRLIVSRYIHLNPVEANIVETAHDYRWSSYRAYLGITKKPEWLSINDILDQIKTTKLLDHVINYHDYVENKELDQINVFSSTKHTMPILGSAKSREKILLKIDAKINEACGPDLNRSKENPKIEIIIDYVCEFYKIKHTWLIHSQRAQLNWPKLACIYLCRKRFGHSIKSISIVFESNCHVTISTAITRCEQLLLQQKKLRDEINQIHQAIRSHMLG